MIYLSNKKVFYIDQSASDAAAEGTKHWVKVRVQLVKELRWERILSRYRHNNFYLFFLTSRTSSYVRILSYHP